MKEETLDLPLSQMPWPSAQWDCHAHVFSRATEAEEKEGGWHVGATLARYREQVLEPLGIENCVLVQPARYGTDNTVLLQALGQMATRALGVAVLAPRVSDGELLTMHAAGIRAIRIAPRLGNMVPLERNIELATRVTDLGWHVQLYADFPEIVELAQTFLAASNATIVLDHFARLKPEVAADGSSLAKVIRLLDSGRVWIKLSGPYHLTIEQPPYPSVGALARRYCDSAIERMVWGTDWPHPNLATRPASESAFRECLERWGLSENERRRVLSCNPRVLYESQHADEDARVGRSA